MCLIAPRPAGPPRTRRTSSGSAVPFSKTHCRIQGLKARHAPPPLDGTETPRSRFSNCREDEKRQKEYGGGALFLARRPLCAKQGAGHFFPPQGSSLPRGAGPQLWSKGENEGRALQRKNQAFNLGGRLPAFAARSHVSRAVGVAGVSGMNWGSLGAHPPTVWGPALLPSAPAKPKSSSHPDEDRPAPRFHLTPPPLLKARAPRRFQNIY